MDTEIKYRSNNIQEFYELTLLDESKSVQQKTAETIRIANNHPKKKMITDQYQMPFFRTTIENPTLERLTPRSLQRNIAHT
ncbi:unnamed protein product [Leptidea sinapis]|uniref:Uncharacterized protein n=1 Tax=Leptidea sinapis TaxID=189913 RepID=A0A5E4QET9_9NEOP|nr:unnamed protein product [Leptidea sinapis]